MTPSAIATTIAVTLLIRSIIDPKRKAQTILRRFVITITGTTCLNASPVVSPKSIALVAAHSEIKIPLTETSARAKSVAAKAREILGFL